MRKIFSFFTAMLVAVAVNAQEIPSTDFAAPGYTFTADAATIIGNPPADKVYLDETANPHHIAWSDVSKSVENAVIWKINATRGCYVTVSLDLGPVIASNKHIFCVEILDANGARVDSIAEGPNYTGDGFTDHDAVKVLDGQVLIPAAGEYTIQLKNNRDWCKGSIKNVILTYAADAPEPQHTYTVAGAPAALFGEEWNASYAENDMEFLANQAYTWIKDSVLLNAGTVEFKVVEDHAWTNAWPAQNYKLAIPENGYYSIIIAFNLAADPDSIVEAKAIKVGGIEPEVGGVVYNWAKDAADQIGTTTLGAAGVEISTVKIHTNTDEIPAIKFGNTYKYEEGKYIVIKPAEGKFLAGDTIVFEGVISNDATDGSKYAMVDFFAADTETNLHRGDTLVNGKKQAADPKVENFVLAADQDSIFVGRYGNTGMFVTALTVVRPGVAPEPQHTYTVAGAPATLFGQAWSASYAENDMESYGTDTYFWRKDSVALAAGNVEFKVVEDHGWAKGWPKDNYVIKIDSAGLYNISIIFKPKAEVADSMISVIVYKVGDAVVLPKIILHGEFTGSWADTEEFAIAEDNLTASLKLNLTAGSYQFGMKFDGVWKANGAELTREAPETSLLEGNGNMKITADVDGEYIFTYTFLGEQLAVTYPIIPMENPIDTTKFFTGESWTPDTLSTATWDAENQKVIVNIVQSKQAQWQGQLWLKLPMEVQVGKEYDLSFKAIATKAISGIIVKYQENAEMVIDWDFALEANVSRTFSAANMPGAVGNGVLCIDFGFAPADVIIEISDISIIEHEPTVAPAKFYVTGNDAFTVDAGKTTADSWNIKAFRSESDTMTVALKAGAEYQIKVSVDGTWNTAMGYNDLSEKAPGIIDADGNNHNIGFSLVEDGNVQIIYTGEVFKLIGNFVAEGIDNTAVDAKAVKSLENGILVIRKNGKAYTVTGLEIK